MLKTLRTRRIFFPNGLDRRAFSKTLNMKIDRATRVINIKENGAKNIAAELVLREKIIALPTDTVYGFACSANSASAIENLYELKGRDEAKPVAICVSDLEELKKYGDARHLPDDLLKSLLPGAVTIVLEKTPLLNNPFLNPHTTKIGVRIPDYEFIESVCALSKIPIALTSANPSGAPSSLSIGEFESMFASLGAVFDGGVLGGTRTGSTVIDLSTRGFYEVIRRGSGYDGTISALESFNVRPLEK